MSEPSTDASLGAPTMPSGEARPLTAEQRATIAQQLGDAKPATSGLLVQLGQSVRDRLAHDHTTQREDWFCMNLSSYMGERIAPVLRRLLDAEARVAELEAAPTDSAFFRPGRIYTRDLPVRLPEDRFNFQCLGVGVHPSMGGLRALGFGQSDASSRWLSTIHSPRDWAEGWIDIGPVQADGQVPTDAPAQPVREEADGS